MQHCHQKCADFVILHPRFCEAAPDDADKKPPLNPALLFVNSAIISCAKSLDFFSFMIRLKRFSFHHDSIKCLNSPLLKEIEAQRVVSNFKLLMALGCSKKLMGFFPVRLDRP